jgi:ATP-dependent Clp protease ATP-binding subunit ClpB
MIPTDTLRERLRELPARLKARVVCQDEAIDIVAERLQHAELGLTSPGRPKASFLLLGPTGVGKTKLVLEFTRELLGEGRLVRLDMSEYQTQERLGLLLGRSSAEPGRIAEGFDACGGVGTLLFDEIEKAHPRVLDILLQILEPARLTTGANRVLDFSGWYVAMTSNIGAARIMTMRRSIYETMRRLVQQDAQRELRPEIFARITEAVVMNRLDYPAQSRVATIVVEGEIAAQGDKGHAMTIGTGVTDAVINRGYSERLGARPLRDTAERLVRSALTNDLLEGGRGVGRLRVHSSGTKLELQPTATAADTERSCHGADRT